MNVHAPFNETQIKSLKDYQSNSMYHPFTCPYRGTHVGDGILFPAKDGMVCQDCEYVQTWVHDFMTTIDMGFITIEAPIRKSKIKKIINKL